MLSVVLSKPPVELEIVAVVVSSSGEDVLVVLVFVVELSVVVGGELTSGTVVGFCGDSEVVVEKDTVVFSPKVVVVFLPEQIAFPKGTHLFVTVSNCLFSSQSAKRNLPLKQTKYA